MWCVPAAKAQVTTFARSTSDNLSSWTIKVKCCGIFFNSLVSSWIHSSLEPLCFIAYSRPVQSHRREKYMESLSHTEAWIAPRVNLSKPSTTAIVFQRVIGGHNRDIAHFMMLEKSSEFDFWCKVSGTRVTEVESHAPDMEPILIAARASDNAGWPALLAWLCKYEGFNAYSSTWWESVAAR